jgi:hypothetical protein
MPDPSKPFTRSYSEENFARSFEKLRDRQALVTLALSVIVSLGFGIYVDNLKTVVAGPVLAAVYFGLRALFLTPAEMWDDAKARIQEG